MRFYFIEVFCIISIILISTVILYIFTQDKTIENIATLDKAIFNIDGTCIDSSEYFFSKLQCRKKEFWQDFEINYPKQYKDLTDNLKDNRNCILQIGDISMIVHNQNNWYVIYLINKPIHYLEPEEQQFTHLQEVNLNLSGYFVTDGKYIYRKEIEQQNHSKIVKFHKCCLLQEMQSIVLKAKHSTMLKNVPIPFLVCNRDGKILMYSKEFLNMFNITNEIKDIADFLDNIRGKIIADSVKFTQVNDGLYGLIQTLSSDLSKKFNTLDNRTIRVDYKAVNNIIYMVYNDISNQFDSNYIDDIFTEIKEILCNKITDIILEIKENKIYFSNCDQIKIGYSKGDAINYLRNLDTEYEIVNCKSRKFLIGHSSQLKVLGDIVDRVNNRVNKIETVSLLISQKNHEFLPYLYLVRFLKLQITNLLEFTKLYNSKYSFKEEVININKIVSEIVDEVKNDLNMPTLCVIDNLVTEVHIKYDKNITIFAIKQMIVEILNCQKNEKLTVDLENNQITFSTGTNVEIRLFDMLNIPFNHQDNKLFKIYFPVEYVQESTNK